MSEEGLFDLCGVLDFGGCEDETDSESDSKDSDDLEMPSLLSREIIVIDGLPKECTSELLSYFGGNPVPPFKHDLTDRVDIAKRILRLCYASDPGTLWEDDWFARIRLNQYHAGGRFEWHQDQVVQTILSDESNSTNNTTNTVLVYLTDCDKGGETEFIIRKGAADGRIPHEHLNSTIRIDGLSITSGSKCFDKLRCVS